ncbi:sensor histidine kinase [Glacieibacterium frigidum]|uniref:histidine kinase n=1 Tax=Glacieibacterium frigidum TaxID=2593303 RepID=A0A552UHW2_9SPHN|nr:HAMP domain-containing sensor histidine kinase [Glacieibacterium frigidum]TRW17815.1 HAMP domain-containing histidine kinase [Glacieibacterium frigidum]
MTPRRRGSISARFAALAVVVLIVTSAALLAFVARVSDAVASADLAALIDQHADDIAAVFERDGAGGAAAMLGSTARPGEITLLTDPAGARLAGNLSRWPAGLPVPATRSNIELTVRGEAARYSIVARRLPGGWRLLVGESRAPLASLRAALRDALLGAMVLAVALALAGAWMLTRFVGSRVRDIADAASRFDGGDLGRRVPLSGDGDAFDALAVSLNAMLARIETLVAELRIVTDTLAHDLRSPLTRLRARIDRAATHPDPELLDGIAAEASLLLRMLDTALEISRAEAGIGVERFAALDLAAFVEELGDMYRPIAEDAGMFLTVDAAPATARAHRELLGQALANLIDNALRHGAGAIALGVRSGEGRVVLSVADRGPGIAAEDRARAVERFARLDRARGTPGAGLGLSLAAAVARLHGGTLALGDNAPGLVVTLDLPG